MCRVRFHTASAKTGHSSLMQNRAEQRGRSSQSTVDTANYTSENIAHGLGLEGFASDFQLAASDRSMRLLLLRPSFHVEVCITLLDRSGAVDVIVVAARQQIWQQIWPAPRPTEVDRSVGILSGSVFESLSQSLAEARTAPAQGVAILDGMRVHAILRSQRATQIEINDNPGRRSSYGLFVAHFLREVWNSISDSATRNAVRNAGSYVGLELPEEAVPPIEPMVRTVVFGPVDVASQILDALEAHHKK